MGKSAASAHHVHKVVPSDSTNDIRVPEQPSYVHTCQGGQVVVPAHIRHAQTVVQQCSTTYGGGDDMRTGYQGVKRCPPGHKPTAMPHGPSCHRTQAAGFTLACTVVGGVLSQTSLHMLLSVGMQLLCDPLTSKPPEQCSRPLANATTPLTSGQPPYQCKKAIGLPSAARNSVSPSSTNLLIMKYRNQLPAYAHTRQSRHCEAVGGWSRDKGQVECSRVCPKGQPASLISTEQPRGGSQGVTVKVPPPLPRSATPTP